MCYRHTVHATLGEYKANMLGWHLLDRQVEIVKEHC
jgi:hypothetical protein